MARLLARITKVSARSDLSLVEDAVGVALLFLLLFVWLWIPGFA